MDELTKELISIGASVGAHCQPCLAYHVDNARKLGVTEQDIQAAIGIGFMVEKGASKAMRDFVGEVSTQAQTQAQACCSGGNSGCCG